VSFKTFIFIEKQLTVNIFYESDIIWMPDFSKYETRVWTGDQVAYIS